MRKIWFASPKTEIDNERFRSEVDARSQEPFMKFSLRIADVSKVDETMI